MFLLWFLLDIFVFVVGLRVINMLLKAVGAALDRADREIQNKICGRCRKADKAIDHMLDDL